MLNDILAHYRDTDEAARLLRGSGELERIRTQELLLRYLEPAPARVFDVGGGPGVYAEWLLGLGYDVDLIDPVPRHVEQARARIVSMSGARGRVHLGDARSLDFPDACADGVLFLGPLYHLVRREDRIRALAEAWRLLRPGGFAFVAGISRFASLLDGFSRGFVSDPVFVEIMEQDLADGQHRNRPNRPSYFTTAFFHHPAELREEIDEAGFTIEKLAAVEGPFWCLSGFDEIWSQASTRTLMLDLLRRLDEEESLIGASAHLLAIARKT
jgi:SAM-dependent methyltransferase